jgi:hypothetical protein
LTFDLCKKRDFSLYVYFMILYECCFCFFNLFADYFYFAKVCLEPTFCGLYAQLCSKLADEYRDNQVRVKKKEYSFSLKQDLKDWF